MTSEKVAMAKDAKEKHRAEGVVLGKKGSIKSHSRLFSRVEVMPDNTLIRNRTSGREPYRVRPAGGRDHQTLLLTRTRGVSSQE